MSINYNNLKYKIKDFFINFIYRFKPRGQLRWVITAFLWLIVLCYLGFGIYFAREVYLNQSEEPRVKFSTHIYPFPAAFVGGNIIWAKEYYQQLNYIKEFAERTKTSYSEEKEKIISQLIENRLLEWEASKNGLKITSRDVNDAFEKIVEQSGGVANVQKTLRDLYNMSEAEFKELVRQQVIKEKIQEDLIAQVKVLHILTKDEGRANEVAEKARNNEPWDQLAKTYSEDINTRDNWGNLGWIARGNLVIDNKQVPEFEEAAFKAKINEIFGPIKTEVGFQIGKVEDKKGKIQQSYTNWLNNLKKETRIYTFIK